jgi:hypothetical protein
VANFALAAVLVATSTTGVGATPQAPQLPTVTPRTNCEIMRGTPYVEEVWWIEREWFQLNCVPESWRVGPWAQTPQTANPAPPREAVASYTSQGAVSAHLERIKMCESSGNYRAYNPAGPFYGAYQFLQSTWNSIVGAAGYPQYVGTRPDLAPPYVQDAAAVALYNRSGPGQWPVCSQR